jgi:hypothetical protein
MKKLIIAIIILFPCVSFALESPQDTVGEYLSLLRNGSITVAVEELFSVENLMSKSFGVDYVKLSDSEKRYARKLMEIHLIIPNTYEQLISLLNASTIENMKIESEEKAASKVTFDIVFPDGDKKSNHILLNKTDEKWLIVDMSVGGDQFLSGILGELWLDVKKEESITSVLEIMIGHAIEAKKKYKERKQ